MSFTSQWQKILLIGFDNIKENYSAIIPNEKGKGV